MFAVQTEKHVSGERFSCVVEGFEVLLNIPVSKCSPFWGGITGNVCILFINRMNKAGRLLSA
jgi:hypothetical protein